MRSHIGDIGHLFTIISFISALLGVFAYWNASNKKALEEQTNWKTFARGLFGLHAISVLGIVVSLFMIIKNHWYEYHYAWNHSSNSLPVYYMVSAFWEGQEGSFLLWVFWHAIIGLLLLKWAKSWEAPVMTIFLGIQAILVSMILGVVIGDAKIGSSPFLTMAQAMPEAPIFQNNPDFVPEDGTGLNPLLQNYWMVIHPPTLFLGFALTLVPFAYLVAGLWKEKYTEWVKPAMNWGLPTALILGTGIMMGAYWAYETLNFGGYWNWDPVENAVYVPWLILVAGIHAMMIAQRRGTAMKLSTLLIAGTFFLIIYSTYLTRSGDLEDASVHSFTDAGMGLQLRIFLLALMVGITALIAWRWKKLPSDEKETETYSPDFWVFIGIAVIFISSIQILAGTSIPVFNKLFNTHVAPPANQVQFYSRIQIWFGVGFSFLAGFGQYLWWRGANKANFSLLLRKASYYGIATLFVGFIAVMLTNTFIPEIGQRVLEAGVENDEAKSKIVVDMLAYVLLFAGGLFAIISGGLALSKLLKKNQFKLAGGAVAHLGLGIMLIGILFSAGFSNTLSKNLTAEVISERQSEQFNAEHLMLRRHVPKRMGEFVLRYKGMRFEADGFPSFIPESKLLPLVDDTVLAVRDIEYEGKTYFKRGDSLRIFAQDTYYEIEFTDKNGKSFSLFPRAQVNDNMGLIASPDTRHEFNRDLYTHVSSIPNLKNFQWRGADTLRLRVGDTTFFNDFIAILDSVGPAKKIPGFNAEKTDIMMSAHLSILGRDTVFTAIPSLLIRHASTPSQAQMFTSTEDVPDIGLQVKMANIDPKTGIFTFATRSRQMDYVVLKVSEKPMINLLWTGTILIIIGFGIAWRRRLKENKETLDVRV